MYTCKYASWLVLEFNTRGKVSVLHLETGLTFLRSALSSSTSFASSVVSVSTSSGLSPSPSSSLALSTLSTLVPSSPSPVRAALSRGSFSASASLSEVSVDAICSTCSVVLGLANASSANGVASTLVDDGISTMGLSPFSSLEGSETVTSIVTSPAVGTGTASASGAASGAFFFFLSADTAVFALALPTADLAVEVAVLAEEPAFTSFPVLAVAPAPDFGRVVFGEAPVTVVLAPAEATGLFAAAPVVAAGFLAPAVALVGFFVAPAAAPVPAGFLG